MPGVEPALAHALADELVALTNMLSELAFDLASNPETLRRHMTSLQAVDHATQMQVAIAEMLRSRASVEDRIEAVPLDSLAKSVGRRVAEYRANAVV